MAAANRAEVALRAVHRVTLAVDRRRAQVLAALGGFDAIVATPGHLDLEGLERDVAARVVSLSPDVDGNDLARLVASAVSAGRATDRARAARLPELAALPYDAYLELVRHGSTRQYLIALLSVHHGSVTGAAHAAGLARESLHRLLRRHGLEAQEFRGAGT